MVLRLAHVGGHGGMDFLTTDPQFDHSTVETKGGESEEKSDEEQFSSFQLRSPRSCLVFFLFLPLPQQSKNLDVVQSVSCMF